MCWDVYIYIYIKRDVGNETRVKIIIIIISQQQQEEAAKEEEEATQS